MNRKAEIVPQAEACPPCGISCRDESISPYFDRVITTEETLARVAPSFDRLGITRIADQTGLDRIGIPCFASFRPNAKTLANNQGKGLTKMAAKASAVMESVEFAIAERPEIVTMTATASDLALKQLQIVDIRPQLPIGETLPLNTTLQWVAGYNLLTRQKVFIPLDAVSLDAKSDSLSGICKCTNGLASGNNEEEAVFHALCELIERDAGTLWSLKSREEQFLTAIDPDTWEDVEVNNLLAKVGRAGLQVRLFDQTSDIGVPCVMAIIAETRMPVFHHFDLAAGYGAHPNAARAAIRAITEAAQSRITSIAGSRDDIEPMHYSHVAAKDQLELLQVTPNGGRGVAGEFCLGLPLADLLTATLVSILATSNAGEVFVFPLAGEGNNFSVVKVVAPLLEDRGANINWRPNNRALNLILGL